MSDGQPVVWSTYFATDDVDALAERVTEFGGQSFFEPMDVMDAGRMGFFAHPAAGAFGGWQAGNHKGAELVNEPVVARLEHADHARARGRGGVLRPGLRPRHRDPGASAAATT